MVSLMTDWTPQDDWSQVKVGDTVRAMRPQQMNTGVVVDRYVVGAFSSEEVISLFVEITGVGKQVELVRTYWQLSVPAKPAVVLPTEPGHYVDRTGSGWNIREDATSSLPEENAPYTRLEPIAVTAKKVIAQFRLGKSITTVAEIFGVNQ